MTLDLGKNGDLWNEYDNILLHTILSLFDDCFPLQLSPAEVFERVLKYYEIKKYDGHERKKTLIIERIRRLKDEIIYPGPFWTGSVLLLPEWFSEGNVEMIGKHAEDLIKKIWFNKLFHHENNPGHTLSEIKIERIDDETVFFSSPRIPYADYAPVFEAVFSLQEGLDKKYKMVVDYKIGPFVKIKLDKQNKGKNNVLRLFAYYFLDYVVGFLASNASKGVSSGQKRKLLNAFKKMEKIKYIPNEELIEKIRINKPSDNKGVELIDIVNGMYKKNRDAPVDVLVLPEYSFSTTRLFEQYVYAVLKRVYHNIEFQHPLIEPLPNEDNTPRRPDLIDKEERIIFDAKYKFEYGEMPSYCDIESVNRMSRYLLLTKTTDKWMSNYMGVFVYPNMKMVNYFDGLDSIAKTMKEKVNQSIAEKVEGKTVTTRRVVAKIGLPFPIRRINI